MKLFCILFILVLSFPNLYFSQVKSLDSLFLALKKEQFKKAGFTKDTNQINLKHQIAWKLKGNNSDSAILLLNETVDLIASRLACSKKSILNELKQKPKTFFKKAQNISLIQKLGDSFHFIAVIWDIRGEYTKSLDNNFEALRVWKIIEKNRPDLKFLLQKSKSSSYGNIGVIYEEIGDNKKALSYFYACLNLKKKLKNKQGIAITLGSIGTIHYYQNNTAEAKKYYQEALAIFLEINDESNASSFIGNLAIVLMDEQKYQEAINLLLRGIEIDKKIDKQRGVASKLGNIGLIYTKINDFPNAELNLIKALEISKSLKITNVEIDHHQYLSELYEKVHKNDLALIHYKLFITLKDSLRNDDLIKQQTLLEAEFEFEKKQEKILAKEEKKQALLKADKRKQELVISFLILLIILSLVLFFFVLQFFKKRKKQAELENSKRQLEIEFKLLRTQMNPHFIFNVLNSIHNYINQENNTQASVLLLKFSKLIRTILQQSTKELITLEEEVKQLELYINIEEIRFSNKFNYEIIVENELILEELLIPPMILQPFVENAIIHGISPLKTRKGELKIQIKQRSAHLEIEISDNGMGIDLNKQKDKEHESLSIKLIEERLTILNNNSFKSLEFINLEKGTSVLLKLPLMGVYD